MNLLTIAGGVALILFAVRFLRKGFDHIFGHRLHTWVERLCRRSRLGTAVAGMAFGAAAPSSTTQTLLTLQLLNEGKLPPERMLIFLLGANVGITVTVQLIALHWSEWHPLFLVTGVAAFLWGRAEVLRGVGQVLLALGLVFLGMSLISAAAAVLMTHEDMQIMADVLQRHESLLLIFATALTLVTQSSTATIGLAIALAAAGTGSAANLVSVVLGANLGLAVTTLIAGWRTLAGRQLAAANLLLKGAVIAVACLCLAPLAVKLATLSGDAGRLAANAHTAFNGLVALIGMLFAAPLGRLIKATRPAARDSHHRTTHLDPSALSSPAFALANAAREILQLADDAKNMLVDAWRACREGDRDLVRQLRQRDDAVDEHHAVIKHYLGRIPAGAMTFRDRELHFGLLHFASQLEAIADIAEKSLAREAERRGGQPLALPAEDMAALAELQHRVLQRFDMATTVLTNRDAALARAFQQDGETLKNWCIEAQREHYGRLAGGDFAAQEASARFLEMFNALRRISGLLNTISHTILIA